MFTICTFRCYSTLNSSTSKACLVLLLYRHFYYTADTRNVPMSETNSMTVTNSTATDAACLTRVRILPQASILLTPFFGCVGRRSADTPTPEPTGEPQSPAQAYVSGATYIGCFKETGTDPFSSNVEMDDMTPIVRECRDL